MGQESSQEFDNSINDWMEKVRRAFESQFAMSGDGYSWITDFFKKHVVIKKGDKHYEVPFTEDKSGITFAAAKDWTPVKLSYVTEMQAGHFRDVMVVAEFRGHYPDVPIASGVDYDALIAGDDSPVFVTLPIGKANVKSGNKRYYDEKFLQEMEKQVLEKKPVGLMGHLRPDQRATDFPAEAVHWVGAMRVNEMLWGKGYIPAGEPRNRLQRYKATGKQIATSIDAEADGVWDSKLEAYRMVAETLNLAQIDIAPADRAGISDLAAVPHFTTEMSSSGSKSESINVQEDTMAEKDKAQVIQELTVADVPTLPQAVREQIATEARRGFEEDLRKELELDGKADVLTTVKEMKSKIHLQEKTAVSNRITELATPDPKRKPEEDKSIKVESVRGLVIELVTSRNPKTVQEAEAAYAEVIQSPAVIRALEGAVQETMGPPQRSVVPGQDKSGTKGKFFVKPEIKESVN